MQLALSDRSTFLDRRPTQRRAQQLQKHPLLDRLTARSGKRYRFDVTASWYDDLVDHGLIPALERRGNEGTRPIYLATKRHYRRALQLARLYSLGVTRRDALHIQLFVRGYGVEPWAIREALSRELFHSLRGLKPKLRSRYLTGSAPDKKIGPKHLVAVSRQIGELDPRLRKLEQPLRFYVDATRQAFSARVEDKPHSGLLLATRIAGHPIIEGDPIDQIYLKARAALQYLDRHMFKKMLGHKLIDSPEYTALVLKVMFFVENHALTLLPVFKKLINLNGFGNWAVDLHKQIERHGVPREFQKTQSRQIHKDQPKS